MVILKKKEIFTTNNFMYFFFKTRNFINGTNYFYLYGGNTQRELPEKNISILLNRELQMPSNWLQMVETKGIQKNQERISIQEKSPQIIETYREL